MRPLTIAALACLGLLTPTTTAWTQPVPAESTTAPAHGLTAGPAVAALFAREQRPRAARPPARSTGLQIRAFGSTSTTWFTASSTFKAVLGKSSGQDVGGGLNITQGPGYLEIGARRFSQSGERVFVTDSGQVFPLGIPAKVTMTPLDVTAGWRFRPRFGRVIPHVGLGYTRMTYEETSDFADEDEDVSESFNGFHVLGGVEVRVARWVGLAGEVVRTSVADAIGAGGASQAFDENDLGGTSIRVKLVIGR
jgi:hypothetical protein